MQTIPCFPYRVSSVGEGGYTFAAIPFRSLPRDCRAYRAVASLSPITRQWFGVASPLPTMRRAIAGCNRNTPSFVSPCDQEAGYGALSVRVHRDSLGWLLPIYPLPVVPRIVYSPYVAAIRSIGYRRCAALGNGRRIAVTRRRTLAHFTPARCKPCHRVTVSWL
jgi:hypothetical protein